MMPAMAAAPAVGSPSERAALAPFVWVALVTACFALARPYLGIVHDGILYAAQALAQADPELYRDDVYFRWGSQDRYTLFSPLFAWLGARLGLGVAHMALSAAGLVLFLGASFMAVRALAPAGLRGYAMLAIAASAGTYGPQPIFRMAEPFVSPRPLGEAATLVALALTFSGRRGWALVLLAASALLHPLVALAGLVYWWVHALLALGNRPWLLALPLIPLGAALAGIAPFSQLFETFDDAWLAVVYEINRHLFVTRWTVFDWSRVAFDLVALAAAARLADGAGRTAFRAGLATAVVVVGATAIGADLLHNVLVTNLQPWRALWIVHWLALAGLPLVAVRLWKEGEAGRLVAGLLVFAFATRGLPASFAASLLTAALFVLRSRVASPSAALVRAVLLALAAGAAASWIVGEYRILTNPLYLTDAVRSPVLLVLSRTFPLLALAAAVVWFGLRHGAGRATALAAGVLLIVAAAAWDQRPAFARYVESVAPGSHPFSAIVARGDEVWWDGEGLERGRGLILPWILMQRANYYSVFQHAGQHFNRPTTMELRRRGELVKPFAFQASLCELMDRINPEEKCQPELEAAQDVCKGAPELDYLVLEVDYPGKWVASWSPPVEIGARVPRYHLYPCSRLR